MNLLWLAVLPVGALLYAVSASASTGPAEARPGRNYNPDRRNGGNGGNGGGAGPVDGANAPPPPPPEPPEEFQQGAGPDIPEAGDPYARLIPPAPPNNSRHMLAADTARLLYSLAPGTESADDIAQIKLYQTQEGINPATGNYGPGTGKSFIKYGIVPPHPFYWPSRGTAESKRNYRDNMLWQASQDEVRAEEWQQAAAVM